MRKSHKLAKRIAVPMLSALFMVNSWGFELDVNQLVTNRGLGRSAIIEVYQADAATIEKAINVAVNGELVSFPDQAPYIDSANRLMVPVRFPAETLGAEVGWNGNLRRVTVTNKAHDELPDANIILYIGNKAVSVNGQTKMMDTVATITGNRTMVPVRFISEYLGATVTWDGGNGVAHVFSQGQTQEQIKNIMEEVAQEVKNQQPSGTWVKPVGKQETITVRGKDYKVTTFECGSLPIVVNGTTLSKVKYIPGTASEIEGNIAGTLYITKSDGENNGGVILYGDFGYYRIMCITSSKGISLPNGDGTYDIGYNLLTVEGPKIGEAKKIGYCGVDGYYWIDNPYYEK